jgi:glycoprotein endo-alpha-1,2-mannosidase
MLPRVLLLLALLAPISAASGEQGAQVVEASVAEPDLQEALTTTASSPPAGLQEDAPSTASEEDEDEAEGEAGEHDEAEPAGDATDPPAPAQAAVAGHAERTAEATPTASGAQASTIPAHPESQRSSSSLVLALFYLHFGSKEIDGSYYGWERPIARLPTETSSSHYRTSRSETHGVHRVPSSIASVYFPHRGCYSSRDPAVLNAQMAEMHQAGVHVALLVYAGRPGAVRDRGKDEDVVLVDNVDEAVELAFDAAERHGVQIAFMLDDYAERNARHVQKDIEHLLGRYGERPGLYRDPTRGNRPWVYVHDSYRLPARGLGAIFKPGGGIRGTSTDVVALGLYHNHHQETREHILEAGFDGASTFFGASGYTEGSRPDSWKDIGAWAESRALLWVPTVAPGYDDTPTRPWNKVWRRKRSRGEYYARMWLSAIESNADAIIINSFNDWNHGSQIEPAALEVEAPYDSYGGMPEMFLNETARHAKTFLRSRRDGEGRRHDEL